MGSIVKASQDKEFVAGVSWSTRALPAAAAAALTKAPLCGVVFDFESRECVTNINNLLIALLVPNSYASTRTLSYSIKA